MPFCPNCGKEILAIARFCEHCGGAAARFIEPQQVAPAPPAAEEQPHQQPQPVGLEQPAAPFPQEAESPCQFAGQPAQQPPRYQPEAQFQPFAHMPAPPKKSTVKRNRLIILIVVAGLLGLGTAGFICRESISDIFSGSSVVPSVSNVSTGKGKKDNSKASDGKLCLFGSSCSGAILGTEFGGDGFAKLFPDCPRFSSTSKEPVLLRYKFTPGQTISMELDADSAVSALANGQKTDMPSVMNIKFKYTVKSVNPDGDAVAELEITRMSMRQSGAGQNFTMDSDTWNDAGSELSNVAFAPIKAIVNTPINIALSSRGKVLYVDLDPIVQAMNRAEDAAWTASFGNDAMAGQLKGQINGLMKEASDEMLKSSFIMLPEETVHEGDVYDAGEIVSALENGLGEIRVNARYRVLSVSGDGKQALLQPMGDFRIEPSSKTSMTFDVKHSTINGWILFDIPSGMIQKSAAYVNMNIQVEQGGETANLDTTAKVKFRELIEAK
jgi:hypothetical protein